MELRIDTGNVTALAQLWARAPEIAAEETLRAVTEVDLLAKSALQQQLPRGAGALRGGAGLVGSIFTDERSLSNNVVGIVATNLPYAEPVELGTRPHMPPITPIADWVHAKLNISGDMAVRVAWAIGKKIAKVGTKADLTWQKVSKQIVPEVQRKFAEAINRILDRLGAK